MKNLTRMLCAVSAAIAMAAPVAASDLKKLRKEDEFGSLVVGHKYYDDAGNWHIVNADGTLSGSYNKKKLVGAWNWQGRYYCRNIVLGQKKLPMDCQVVYASQTQTQYHRNKGKGDKSKLHTRR